MGEERKDFKDENLSGYSKEEKMTGYRRYRRVWVKGHYSYYYDSRGRRRRKWIPGYWRREDIQEK